MDNDHKQLNTDTIVALATPRGTGALAIVRLSGDRAIDIAAGMLRNPVVLLASEPRRMHLVEILDEKGELLDRGLCLLYRKPHSYTGENAAEFFLHGSPYIVSRVLERCAQLGARLAGPGEFTQRAFLNGKMDLAQAEAVADLIAASGRAAHRAALAQSQGNLSNRIRELRERLLQVCALVELDIDFSDQDVPLIEIRKLLILLEDTGNNLQSLANSIAQGRLAREGAVVVIAGAPNVGKSTLFNALLGEDRAIVHESPGTTRDVVEALVEWDGLTIRLVDTAGQASYLCGPDQQAVDRARTAMQSADLVLWIVDLTDENDPERPSAEIAERVVLIGNKADLVARVKQEFSQYIQVSALKMEGLEAVKAAVRNRLLPQEKYDYTEGILTRERHLDAVRRALVSLERGRRALEEGRGIELLAEDLREASAALGEIIGEVTPDEVLSRIFAEFCIGK